MNQYDIEKMTDVIDIRGPKMLYINWFEILLVFVLLVICIVLIFFLWKKFFKKVPQQIVIPQIDIYELKSKELVLLIKKLNDYIHLNDIDNCVLILTQIIKVKKEVQLKNKFLHTTTTEFVNQLNIYEDILYTLDKHKYGRIMLTMEDIKNIVNNVLNG